MSLKYVKGTRLWLKSHPEVSEAWLRNLIAGISPGISSCWRRAACLYRRG
jgi:hypothetical protein